MVAAETMLYILRPTITRKRIENPIAALLSLFLLIMVLILRLRDDSSIEVASSIIAVTASSILSSPKSTGSIIGHDHLHQQLVAHSTRGTLTLQEAIEPALTLPFCLVRVFQAIDQFR